MVNLGFEADLTFILDKLPSDTMEGEDQGEQMDVDGETMIKKGRNRVTTLFSATMPPPVERLAKKYLKRPAIITIGEAGRAVDTVEQKVEFVNGDEKKKCVLGTLILLMPLTWATKAENAGDPQQWDVSFAHHCLRQPKEDGRHGRQRSTACRSKQHAIPAYLDRLLTDICSGALRRCTLARIKNSEKPPCNHCARAMQTSWLLQTSRVVVSMYRMSAWSSITRWPTQSRHMSTVLVCHLGLMPEYQL